MHGHDCLFGSEAGLVEIYSGLVGYITVWVMIEPVALAIGHLVDKLVA